MRIAIIGIESQEGTLLASEVKSRGNEVVGIKSFYNDIFSNDLTAENLCQFDAVIDLSGKNICTPAEAEKNSDLIAFLLNIFFDKPDTRFIITRPSNYLFFDTSKQKRVENPAAEGKEQQKINEILAKTDKKVEESSVNWSYFISPEEFDHSQKPTGHFILGSNVRILNPDGKSYITCGDFVLAVADEIEKKEFFGKYVTAVSDNSYNYHERMAFDMTALTPFKRRGGHFGIFCGRPAAQGRGFPASLNYAHSMLYLDSFRGNTYPPDEKGELMQIAPTYNGKTIGFAIHTTPTELTLRTAYGEIHCCYAESDLLYIKGENGLGLRIRKDYTAHEFVKPRGEFAWESMNNWRGCCCLLNPLAGRIKMHAPWDLEKLCTPIMEGFIEPDDTGRFLLTIEETIWSSHVRDSYPTYEEALADVSADWNVFLEKCIPHFSKSLEVRRDEAAYILWAHIVDPSYRLKHQMMYMFSFFPGSQWQMSHHAFALHRDIKMAMDFLMVPFDQASPLGQLPDYYDDSYGGFQAIKPPIHGWALKWIMKNHDLKKEVDQDTLEYIYKGLSKWVNWFFTYRDDDHDGIPQYEHGDETGLDDNSVFQISNVMETPDLSAFLALNYEALGDLAKILDKDQETIDEWYRLSKALIDKMIKTFWKDGRFIALVSGSHQEVRTESILYYLPIVLGKRLPQEIITKIAEDLGKEGDWLTNYGLASEKLTSEDFRLAGMACGPVLPPINLMIAYGLYDAGEEKLAKKIALRFCTSMKDGNFRLIIDPFRGTFGPGASGSWPACAYVALADLCSNM